MQELTQDRLRQLLHYDPETGIFTWIRSVGKSRAGSVAGYKDQYSIKIRVDGRLHRAHRLVWLYVFNKWPEHVVDHINGDWTDNRLGNLRDVPQALNQHNRRRAQSNNASGFLGVHRNGPSWRAMIHKGEERVYLGPFKTKEEAHQAYLLEKRRIHEGCTI